MHHDASRVEVAADLLSSHLVTYLQSVVAAEDEPSSARLRLEAEEQLIRAVVSERTRLEELLNVAPTDFFTLLEEYVEEDAPLTSDTEEPATWDGETPEQTETRVTIFCVGRDLDDLDARVDMFVQDLIQEGVSVTQWGVALDMDTSN